MRRIYSMSKIPGQIRRYTQRQQQLPDVETARSIIFLLRAFMGSKFAALVSDNSLHIELHSNVNFHQSGIYLPTSLSQELCLVSCVLVRSSRHLNHHLAWRQRVTQSCVLASLQHKQYSRLTDNETSFKTELSCKHSAAQQPAVSTTISVKKESNHNAV